MALIPPVYLDCVVAIGADDDEEAKRWIASGFFYGHYLQTAANGKKEYRIYLVTNRHVFEDLSLAYLRCNPQVNQPAKEYKLELKDMTGALRWMTHPNKKIDIAAISINYNLLEEQGMQVNFFRSDEHVASIGKMNELGITEGDFAYVLGFPMGLVGEQRNTVIVRSGTIARVRDTLAKANHSFLVDALIFPGNSGGPVVLKPEILSIEGTKPVGNAYLIGIVYSYLLYKDVAYSLQTKQPRVVFEENSGLSQVHPVDFIQETISAFR